MSCTSHHVITAVLCRGRVIYDANIFHDRHLMSTQGCDLQSANDLQDSGWTEEQQRSTSVTLMRCTGGTESTRRLDFMKKVKFFKCTCLVRWKQNEQMCSLRARRGVKCARGESRQQARSSMFSGERTWDKWKTFSPAEKGLFMKNYSNATNKSGCWILTSHDDMPNEMMLPPLYFSPHSVWHQTKIWKDLL